MGLQITELPYLKCNAVLLSALGESGHVAFLDSSATAEHQDGRWSILAAATGENIVSSHSSFSDDILNKCQNWMNRTQSSQYHLPFTGGIFGQLSYQLGTTMMGVSSQHHQPLPEYELLFCSWAYLWDHVEAKCYLVHWPELCDIRPNKLTELYLDSLQATDEKAGFQLLGEFKPSWSKQDYKEKFDRIKEYILAGDAYQINLTQHFESSFKGTPASAFFNLSSKAEVPFATYWKSKHFTWMSASPERFIEVNGNRVQTRPIKGTRPRTFDDTIDQQSAIELKYHPKDNAENLMIVDLLRNDLSKNCDNVKVPELFKVEWFPTVLHLVSTIEGSLRANTSPLKLLLDAFPGGSITGAPKKRAMEIIDELEFCSRSHYCGSTFYWSGNGRMDSNILIRSFLFEQDRVHCWGGGGIVADSEWKAEHQESLDKVSRLMKWLEA